jgi:hypothetical protein
MLFIAGIAFFFKMEVWAGAWSQEQGHFYLKFSGLLYASDEFYDDMGQKRPMGMDDDRFESGKAFLYLEYGLMKRLTVITQLQQGVITSENKLMRSRTMGVGDFDFGVKYQVMDTPLVLAPFVAVKIPTGYHNNYDPALGTGKVDVETRLLIARSFYPWPVYIGVDGGYRLNGGIYSNQIPYFLEIGGSPHRKVFVKGYIDGKDTLTRKSQNTGEIDFSSLWVFEGDFTKMGVSIALNLRGSLWGDLLIERIVTGENSGAGGSFGVGVAYKY